MRLFLTISACVFALGGCGGSPGEQCLKSFRGQLKDPESGRVIAFVDPELTYTATNGYGARIQGKALCRNAGDHWERDHFAEQLKILETSNDTLHAFNVCRDGGESAERCAGESLVLKRTKSVDINALNAESARSLGF
jgi:hypothetical protein